VNGTDFDYRVSDGEDVQMSVKLARENSISLPLKGNENGLSGDFPVFAPSRGRSRFGIHINYPYSEKFAYSASEDDRHDYETRLAKYVATDLGNVDGFVIFDGSKRYEIVFPNGWKERGKEQLRIKASERKDQPVQTTKP
jgi:hypothetical protein